jgi:ubiquinone biosynthesis protein
VLTEDFVTGNEVSDVDFLKTLGDEERERIAALIADNFASQVLTDGFYHADPHSGNVFIMPPIPRETSASVSEATEDGEASEQTVQLPEHPIEWIDFGMMGTLTTKQRQLLIDIVTNVVMHDAYALKNTVLQIAQPEGEINHGALLEMCEGMCGQYTGADFGDFDLGDLLGTILGGLQDEHFKIDPFITNLARGITAVEGTIKTLSPKVNILNYFTSKVNTGLNFNINMEHPEEMNPEIAMKLLQLANGIIDSTVKTAETLDMLEKGQLKVRTDFSFEEKALNAVSRIMGYVIRALIIVALIISSGLLCTTSALTADKVVGAVAFRAVGICGFIVSLFFAQRLFREMKNGK